MSLAHRLVSQRKALNLTQSDVAKAVGVSQQAIERIEAGATSNPRKIVLIAKVLQTTPDWLLHGQGDEPDDQGVPDVQGVPGVPHAGYLPTGQTIDLNSRRTMIRDLPVLGRAAGSETGTMIMEGDPIDWTWRPHNLDKVEDAFAVFVTGLSMEPRYFAGDIVYVHPTRPIRSGRHVLVETRRHEGLIKRFDGWSSTHLRLWQYNPGQEILIRKEDILRTMLVVGTSEEG